MSIISREEFDENDDREGKPAFIAVNGEVHDASASSLWKNGTHMDKHVAGRDLTEAPCDAPHGIEMLERYSKSGEPEPGVEADPKNTPRLPWWASVMIFARSHQMFTPFPQALFVLAPIFLTLFYAAKFPDFERTAFFLMVAGLLTTILATITGIIHRQFKFRGKSRPAFKLKIFLSPLLVLLAAVTVGVHLGCGKLSPEEVDLRILILYWIHFPVASALGRTGGNIVFGGK